MTDEFAVLNIHPYSRHAHQLAGHAIAVVISGGKLNEIQLGSVNFSTADEDADTPWIVRHTTPDANRPLFIFSGVWASAMWLCENDDAHYYDAMYLAWLDNTDGITEEYESRVKELAAHFGTAVDERAWEPEWYRQLEPLWPAVCEIAAMLLDGQSVTHDDVQAAVDRCPKPFPTTPYFSGDDQGVGGQQ